jgi:hypothetical protein
VALGALALTGCGDDDPPEASTTTSTAAESGHDHAGGTNGPCGEPIPEALDPNSGRHLLPGQPEPAYLSDPPTSGPHRSGSHPTGVLPDPIEKPVQVAMLEAGQVIIQHKDLDKTDFDRVTALATEHVSVAPAAVLPGKIVATAWQVKLICTNVDADALRSFVTKFVDPEKSH